jgi:hypothetical protein
MNRIFFLSLVLITATSVYVTADLQGLPAEITVNVIGCQQYPLDSARVILLGTAEAENLGNGNYRFAEVYPGEHELFAYSDYSDSYREKLTIGESCAKTHLNVMLCTCVECVTPIEVNVVDSKGKKVKGAQVSVPALFLEYATDKKGRATFEAPAGEWTITATADGLEGSIISEVPFVEPGEEIPPVIFTITIK